MSTPSRRSSLGKGLCGILVIAAALLSLPVYDGLTGPGHWQLAERIGPMIVVALLAAALVVVLCGGVLVQLLERRGYTRRATEIYGGTLSAVASGAGLVAVFAAEDGRWLAVPVRLSVPVMVLGIGVLVFRALRTPAPQGAPRFRCQDCGYGFGFEREKDAPEQCSECGAPWRGRLVPDVPKPPRIFWPTAGLSVLVLSFVFLLIPAVPWAAALPTSALIHWAGMWPADENAWGAIATRQLTEAEAERLAERVLNTRGRRHWALSAGAHRWLEGQIAAGTLTPELRERFFAEMVVLQLDTLSSRPRVGDSFFVGVTARRDEAGFLYRPVVYSRGATLGEQTFERDAAEVGMTPWIPRTFPGALPAAHTRIYPATPGTFPARIEAWVIIGPFPVTPPTITWNADGTPVLPAGAEWSRRVVVEGQVTIRPR